MSINRNSMYRERPVRLTIKGSALQSVSESLTLREVTSLRESTIGGVAMVRGVISAIIQPWYFQPIVVDIMGKSYMGAFAETLTSNPNVSTDNDVTTLIRFRDMVNQTFIRTSSTIKDLEMRLDYGTGGRAGLNASNQTLVGFIDEMTIEETEDAPYIQSYTIKFTGELEVAKDTKQGAIDALADVQTTEGAQTPSIGMTGAR